MLKEDLVDKYDIFNIYDSVGILDALFSFNELDPMFWAESDAYNLAGNKPFVTSAAIGPGKQVIVYIIVFNSHEGRYQYLADTYKSITNL
jgi:hypothetical protein